MDYRYSNVPDYLGDNKEVRSTEQSHFTEIPGVRVCAKCGTENSAGKKVCETCGEKLGAAISCEEAESVGMEIRAANGTEEKSLTRAQVKKRLTAGVVLSIVAVVMAVFSAAMTFYDAFYYGLPQESLTTNENMYVTVCMLSVVLLPWNIILCASPKLAVKISNFFMMLRYPIRFILWNREGLIIDQEDFDRSDIYCTIGMIIPILVMLIAIGKLILLFNIYGFDVYCSFFGNIVG